MNEFCVYLTTYSGTKLPPLYVGSTSVDKIKSGYHGSVASRKYCSLWKEELKSNPEAFTTAIISYHPTRKDAVDAELEWQLAHRVVEDKKFINMSYAKSKFYGLSTPELLEAFRQAIADRTPEEKAAIKKMCSERQIRVLSSRSPEKVKITAYKQAKSLSLAHAKATPEKKAIIAQKKREKLASHDEAWHTEVNLRRSVSITAAWARRKAAKNGE